MDSCPKAAGMMMIAHVTENNTDGWDRQAWGCCCYWGAWVRITIITSAHAADRRMPCQALPLQDIGEKNIRKNSRIGDSRCWNPGKSGRRLFQPTEQKHRWKGSDTFMPKQRLLFCAHPYRLEISKDTSQENWVLYKGFVPVETEITIMPPAFWMHCSYENWLRKWK